MPLIMFGAVDVDFLLLKYMQSDLVMGEIVRARCRGHKRCSDPFTLSLLHKRLSKPDCLHNGWIVVGYPTCKADAELMDDTFTTKPNRYRVEIKSKRQLISILV